MVSAITHPRTYQSGAFSLQVGARLLLRDGERLAVGSKAFEMLTCLVMHGGEASNEGF